MLSWAFPVVTTVWGLQPVVWVVMVSGALSRPPWGTGARSWEEPVFLGEALGADLVWPLCGLGCEHIVPMLAVPLEWDLWKCTEEITLKGSWWECSLMAFLRKAKGVRELCLSQCICLFSCLMQESTPVDRKEQRLAAAGCQPASGHSHLGIHGEPGGGGKHYGLLSVNSPHSQDTEWSECAQQGGFPRCVALMDGVTSTDNKLGLFIKEAWEFL